jgi:hypothetical protein
MIWFRIRKALLPNNERSLLERFSPTVISAILYGGYSGPVTTEPMRSLYENSEFRTHAAEWLTEQYDREERKETWSITMEVAITLLVAVELLFSVLNFVSHKG